jgi:general secretion pathway protein E
MADKESLEPASDEFIRNGMLTGDDINESLALQFGMQIYKDLTNFRLPRDFYKKIPYSFAKKNVILPIEELQNVIIVAVADPINLEPLEELRLLIDREVKPVYSPKEVILSAVHECYNQEHSGASQLIADMAERSDEDRIDGEIEIYDLLDRKKMAFACVIVLMVFC